ncbi:MAG: protease [Cytophagia bacterium]|nr:protease [Cytophagia bacterium]
MMKKVLSMAVLAAAIVMVSCQQDESLISQEISQVSLDKISSLGFSTQDVQRVNGGYLVEGEAFSTAVNNALARYNAQNLSLTFSRVSSGGNIVIRLVNSTQFIASAGFPSGGNPYNQISYARTYATGYSDGFMTTVIAHELGHCIGFRHTDYMNRAYSCGGAATNEGASGVGAIHIPGTPTTADPGSWMLACSGASTNRPFNNNDITALRYLY